MKYTKAILAIVAFIIVVPIVVLFLVGFLKPKEGGIFVDSSPSSNVYINGSFVGKTPYRGSAEPGQILLKMVPDESFSGMIPFETKITITSGVETIVRREFGSDENKSSGDVISFEKASKQQGGIIVVSTPENAQVFIDGVAKGFAPYKNTSINVGEHQVSVKAIGYTDRIMTVRTIEGYRLTVFAKLAEDVVVKDEEPRTEIVTMVRILDTPTGFLRVRTEPGSAGSEIDQVTPGSEYQLIEEDKKTGWYKILLEPPVPGLPDGRSGWVSNDYSEKADKEKTVDSNSEDPK